MNSVLVFRSAALGDFIMACPAIAAVRNKFPNHRVILLTIQSSEKKQRKKVEKYSGGSGRVPWVELAMPHLIDEVITLEHLTNLRYLWQLRRTLKKLSISTAIVMLDPCSPLLGRVKKLLLLYFLIGRKPVLGWRDKGALKSNLKNASKLKREGRLKHHVHGPLQFLSEMMPSKSYSDENLIFDLRPGKDAEKWFSNWLHEHGDMRCKLVAVAPGSIQPHKRWPIDSFKSLLVLLLERFNDVKFVVIGAPADKELGDTLTAINPEKIYNLAGSSSIAQSAALLRHCALLVGNDGGAMHLGDAMGCKVVSILPGIEYQDSVEPWNNKQLAIRWPVSCAPCYSFTSCPEGHNHCMTEIPVSLVLEKCASVL